MLTLEDIKKLNEERAKCKPFEAIDVPIGVQVINDDFTIKTTIKAVVRGEIQFGGDVGSTTSKELLDNWILIHPQGGIMVCGIPDDSGIVTPSDMANGEWNIIK